MFLHVCSLYMSVHPKEDIWISPFSKKIGNLFFKMSWAHKNLPIHNWFCSSDEAGLLYPSIHLSTGGTAHLRTTEIQHQIQLDPAWGMLHLHPSQGSFLLHSHFFGHGAIEGGGNSNGNGTSHGVRGMATVRDKVARADAATIWRWR